MTTTQPSTPARGTKVHYRDAFGIHEGTFDGEAYPAHPGSGWYRVKFPGWGTSQHVALLRADQFWAVP